MREPNKEGGCNESIPRTNKKAEELLQCRIDLDSEARAVEVVLGTPTWNPVQNRVRDRCIHCIGSISASISLGYSAAVSVAESLPNPKFLHHVPRVQTSQSRVCGERICRGTWHKVDLKPRLSDQIPPFLDEFPVSHLQLVADHHPSTVGRHRVVCCPRDGVRYRNQPRGQPLPLRLEFWPRAEPQKAGTPPLGRDKQACPACEGSGSPREASDGNDIGSRSRWEGRHMGSGESGGLRFKTKDMVDARIMHHVQPQNPPTFATLYFRGSAGATGLRGDIASCRFLSSREHDDLRQHCLGIGSVL